ncbi:endosomal/lysosomal proton channel TMEM175-like isoform X2 [Lineus longissimus]|uniref:endosomal/lysosomal proton channel TMEM175-like isoform X2 n=1 Tax=Lineus longissimus TaxID=88925 RepID=UPI002B4F2327
MASMAGLGELSTGALASCGRVEAYSDAIFSIVATIMILPIAHSEIEEDADLRESLVNMIPKLFVYFVSFLLICSLWASHCWLFETIEKTDEVILMLNLGLMMVVTFLPYTFTLLGDFAQDPLAIILFCCAVVLVQLLQVFFIFYAFRTPNILHVEVRISEDKTRRRNVMYFTAVVPMVLCLLAMILASFSPLAADLCLLVLAFSTLIKKGILMIYRRQRAHFMRENSEENPVPMSAIRPSFRVLLEDSIPKERIIAFSDGVFAIVATLIILDISEGSLPSPDDVVKFGSLALALAQHDQIFLAYGATFVTVGMLWFVHHSLLEHITDMNKLMGFFNTLCLGCIGLSPLGFKLTSLFELHEHYYNEMVAMHLSCAIIFLAGILQCAIWVTGLCTPQRHVTTDGNFGGKSHAYLTAKLMLYPVMSLFVYFLSFASFGLTLQALNGMQIGAPLVFLVVYLGFRKIPRQTSRANHGDLHGPNLPSLSWLSESHGLHERTTPSPSSGQGRN